MDLLAPTTASAAPRAIDTANSDASATPCIIRELSATPVSLESAVVSGMGEMLSGRSWPPESHCTQFATVGQVMVDAFDPTTSPKWPARIITSYTSALGAARLIPRTEAGWPMSSTSPTNASIGQVISVSVTNWPLMAKPPVIIRLCVTNCLSSSETAGPDQAIQPSLSRKRRCCSRGSSASRSCSCSRNSTRDFAVLRGSRSWNPVRASQLGMSMRLNTWSARKSATTTPILAGIPIGSAARVSTGEPKATTLATSLDRR